MEVVRGPSRAATSPRDAVVAQRPATVKSIDLTVMPLGLALETLCSYDVIGAARKYEWSVDGGMYTVRPTVFNRNPSVALSRVVGEFSWHFDNVAEILSSVHRVFDKSYPSPQPTHEPERLRSLVEMSIDLKLASVTVRQILNAAASQHGSMSWIAEYADASGGY